jgi:hypothetical protein
MLRDGPIPLSLHALAEYAIGVLFVVLPLLLDYKSGAATAASILIGIALIAVAASTDWTLSLIDNIPKAAHVVIDYLVAALLVASPFLFGFSSEAAPTAVFIAAGILHLLVTIGTRFVKDDGSRKSRRDEPAPAAPPPGSANG